MYTHQKETWCGMQDVAGYTGNDHIAKIFQGINHCLFGATKMDKIDNTIDAETKFHAYLDSCKSIRKNVPVYLSRSLAFRLLVIWLIAIEFIMLTL